MGDEGGKWKYTCKPTFFDDVSLPLLILLKELEDLLYAS